MKINHLGIAVKNATSSASDYEVSLGWKKETELIHDPKQKVKIIFMVDDYGNRYELLEPEGDKSPINQLLKQRISLYHICYEIESIHLKIEELRSKGFFLISGPVEAVAFNGKLIAFLINRDNLIIELLEV